MKTARKRKSHKFMQNFIQINGIILLLILSLSISTVYAHRMMIEPVDEHTIQVVYENGDGIKHAGIRILDENGEVIEEGKADEKGYYSLDDSDRAHSVIAEDGTGHQATWAVGSAVESHGEWTHYIRIIGVAAALILLSLYFGKRARERSR